MSLGSIVIPRHVITWFQMEYGMSEAFLRASETPSWLAWLDVQRIVNSAHHGVPRAGGSGTANQTGSSASADLMDVDMDIAGSSSIDSMEEPLRMDDTVFESTSAKVDKLPPTFESSKTTTTKARVDEDIAKIGRLISDGVGPTTRCRLSKKMRLMKCGDLFNRRPFIQLLKIG
jgi:hypothetical protein